jgi:signal transduction histidine kinase
MVFPRSTLIRIVSAGHPEPDNNALKYAKDGEDNYRSRRTGAELQIEVRDFGPGIPEARQATIFEPGYQQAHPDERSGGLGIGLALCKALVELTEVVSGNKQTGKGLQLLFTIPLKRSGRHSFPFWDGL